jgi:hypothetical protein
MALVTHLASTVGLLPRGHCRYQRAALLTAVIVCVVSVSWAQKSPAPQGQSTGSLTASLRRADNGTQLHIFYVHGMGIEPAKAGSQDFEASQEFRTSFCHQIHCTSKLEGRSYANEGHFAIKNGKPTLTYLGENLWGRNDPQDWHAAAPFVANYTLMRDNGTKIFLHEINWWPLVLSAKCRQIVAPEAALVDRDRKHSAICLAPTVADQDGRYSSYSWITENEVGKRQAPWRKAAVINRWLKHDILDWGFADALLAVGPLHKYLIEGIREVILQSFTEADNQEFVIVSHSLGSYLMFSALDLRTNPPAPPCSSRSGQPCSTENPQGPSAAKIAEWKPRFENLLRHTSYAYFMANQLRLLQLANLEENQDGAKFTQVLTHLDVWADSRAEAGEVPPTIVAFSDADDFLTWQLPPQAGRKDSKGNSVCIEDRPANNVRRWLWLFADPTTAHIGYDKNKSVINVMLPKESQGQANTKSGKKQRGDSTCQSQ